MEKNMRKRLAPIPALLLTLTILTSCFGIQITGNDPAPDKTEPDAPETDAPGTDAPETDAPETDAPETEAPVTVIPVNFTPDFESSSLARVRPRAPEVRRRIGDTVLLDARRRPCSR